MTLWNFDISRCNIRALKCLRNVLKELWSGWYFSGHGVMAERDMYFQFVKGLEWGAQFLLKHILSSFTSFFKHTIPYT